ncbi:MAG: inorganic diphosphatase, partial [Candidatus Hodarchaeota archaeon]
WKNIIPGPNPPKIVYALIECPKGTQNKYEISKKANVILLDRVLHSSVIYPHDYGLIPGTLAEDKDPLDILVLTSNPTAPLTIIPTHPIGVLIMEDEKGLDEKILGCNENDPIFRDYKDIVQLPTHILDEIKEFFRTYKNLENAAYSSPKEWRGREAAYLLIEESIKRFKEKFKDIERIDPLLEEE